MTKLAIVRNAVDSIILREVRLSLPRETRHQVLDRREPGQRSRLMRMRLRAV